MSVRTYKVLRPVPRVEFLLFMADWTFFSEPSSVEMVPHGDNFTAWFTGKVEEDAPEGNLQPFVLIQRAYDRDIIADLGGEKNAETTLAEIWRLMQRQANGEGGVLLTKGYTNVFYVRDTSGVFRAVGVCWIDGGWHAGADTLDGIGWEKGNQVFSRNF